jgi:hypothetical protein
MTDITMIKISELPLIESLTQFHQTNHILLVDVLFVGDAPRNMREHIKLNHGGFVFNKQTYMPITLTGNPESLIANAEKGIHFKFDHGFQNVYFLNSNLEHTILQKKIYDMSAYEGNTQIQFVPELDFIIDRYLINAIPDVVKNIEPLSVPSLLNLPKNETGIGSKPMVGFKPVRK